MIAILRILLTATTASVLFCAGHALAQAQAPNRFADGTEVPIASSFVSANPEDPKSVIPRYPPRFAAQGVGGTFVGDVTISEHGQATDVAIVSGIHPGFNTHIIRHLKKVLFTPAQLDGRPVASLYRVTLDFYPPRPVPAR